MSNGNSGARIISKSAFQKVSKVLKNEIITTEARKEVNIYEISKFLYVTDYWKFVHMTIIVHI